MCACLATGFAWALLARANVIRPYERPGVHPDMPHHEMTPLRCDVCASMACHTLCTSVYNRYATAIVHEEMYGTRCNAPRQSSARHDQTRR
jgi:hypothetical protein